MATLQRTYDCLTCRAPIKLEIKDDGSGWYKFNIDGSSHFHPRKNGYQQQQPPVTATPAPATEEPKALVTERQIATLAQVVSDLESKIDELIKEVKEVKAKK